MEIVKTREDYIDIAKSIGIFLVVFTHNPFFLSCYEELVGIIKWVGAFHMPLFFFTYGIVSNKKLIGLHGWRIFIDKRIRNLIIPYLVWALFYGKLSSETLPLILWGTNISLATADSNTLLWFFPTMFLATLLYQIYVQHIYIYPKYKYVFASIFTIVSVCLALVLKKIWMPYCHFAGIDIAFTCVLFMISGELLKPIITYCAQKKIVKGIIIVLAFILNTVVSEINADETVGGYVVAYADFGKNYYIYIIINAVIMCFAIVMLSTYLKRIKIFAWLGKYSIVIMVLHYFIFEYTSPICARIADWNTMLGVLTNTLLAIVLCIPFIFFLERYLPEAIGKMRKNNG